MKKQVKMEKSLAAPDPVSLTGRRALNLEMARVYNCFGKGLYLGAKKMRVSAAAMAGVIHVVSSGNVEDKKGRMIVSFSPERFFHFWGRKNEKNYFRSFNFKKGPKAWFTESFRPLGSEQFLKIHGKPDLEWQAFDLACRLSEHDALRALNMGLGQVMGYNYSLAGFKSVEAMYKAMSCSAKAQMDGLCGFLWHRAGSIFNLEVENTLGFCKVFFDGPEVKRLAKKMDTAIVAYRKVSHGRRYEAQPPTKKAASQIGNRH